MNTENADPHGETRIRRTNRLEEIVAAASVLFNDRGPGSVGLAEVARHTGMARATVYHHVENREDLVFRCFQRSIELDLQRITEADDSTTLARLLSYLKNSLSEEARNQAVITDVGMLQGDRRELIEQGVRQVYSRLEQTLAEGIERNEVRSCDVRITARVLPSIASFIRLAHRWVEPGRNPRNPAAIVDLIKSGIAADRQATFHAQVSADSFSSLSIANFESKSITDIRKEQILMVGSKLINRRGIDSVSLDDVAEELGVTRGGVYHYFKDKADFLTQCMNRGLDLYDAFTRFAERAGGTGLEKASIVSHLNTQALVGPLQPVLAWVNLDAYSQSHRKKARARLRDILARNEAIAREGIADGSRRNLDIDTVTIARAGAYMWIPKWIGDVEGATPQVVADEVVALLSKGLEPL